MAERAELRTFIRRLPITTIVAAILALVAAVLPCPALAGDIASIRPVRFHRVLRLVERLFERWQPVDGHARTDARLQPAADFHRDIFAARPARPEDRVLDLARRAIPVRDRRRTIAGARQRSAAWRRADDHRAFTGIDVAAIRGSTGLEPTRADAAGSVVRGMVLRAQESPGCRWNVHGARGVAETFPRGSCRIFFVRPPLARARLDDRFFCRRRTVNQSRPLVRTGYARTADLVSRRGARRTHRAELLCEKPSRISPVPRSSQSRSSQSGYSPRSSISR